MNFITGEQLRLLEAPAQPRRQLSGLMGYLHTKGAANHHVCALYSLRRSCKAEKQIYGWGKSVYQAGFTVQ